MQKPSSATLSFIGGGNMAGALIGGLLKAGHEAARLRVAEVSEARRDQLRMQFGIPVETTPQAAADGADAVVIAVKPQQAAEALRGLRLAPGTTVISIAAGLRLAAFEKLLGKGLHLVRSMPNTPALLGQGISALYTPEATPRAARALAETVLGAAGPTLWLAREEDMDAVTALSGSGPAYFFLLTEALRESGIKLGLAPEAAARLAQQTFIGAAAMAAQPNANLVQLRANVTSKGGTTEAAVNYLESGGLRSLFDGALRAAQQRGAELGDSLENPV